MMFRIQSFKQAAFWSTAINAFSQGLALIFSMVMAAVFGAQEGTDILYYCIGLFMLASQMVQSVNVGVLVPETMRRRHQLGEEDAMAFINRFFAVFGGLIAVFVLWLLWNPVRSIALISRFPEEVLARNSSILFWLILSFPLQMMAQLLLDILVSYRYLTLPATLSCINRAINVLFVLLFHRSLGVASVAMGMALGFGLQVLLNLGLLVHVIHWRPFVWKTKVHNSTYKNIAWVELGTLSSALAGYLPLFLFSGFSAGAMTVLNYARRMSNMPVELLTAQVASVVAVKFNEQTARRDFAGIGRSFDRLMRMIVLFLTPLTFLLALAGRSIISIFFERGAFDTAAVVETAGLFSILVLTLPLVAIDNVVGRLFIARQEVALGTRCQIFNSALTGAMVFGFVTWLGPRGFAVGIFLTQCIYLMVLATIFPARLAPVVLWPTLCNLVRTAGGCGTIALVVWFGVEWMLSTAAGPWWTGVFRCGLFVAAYGAILRWCPPDRLGRDEGVELVRAGIRRLWIRGGGGGHPEGRLFS